MKRFLIVSLWTIMVSFVMLVHPAFADIDVTIQPGHTATIPDGTQSIACLCTPNSDVSTTLQFLASRQGVVKSVYNWLINGDNTDPDLLTGQWEDATLIYNQGHNNVRCHLFD